MEGRLKIMTMFNRLGVMFVLAAVGAAYVLGLLMGGSNSAIILLAGAVSMALDLIYRWRSHPSDGWTRFLHPQKGGSILLPAWLIGAALFSGGLLTNAALGAFLNLWAAPTAEPPGARTSRSISRLQTTPAHCTLWSEIGLDDVGSQRCVYGIVESAYATDQTFYVTFAKGRGFYFVSHEFIFPEVQAGACVMALGQIEQIADDPVIALTPQTNLYYC